jgi:hypothetical protein
MKIYDITDEERAYLTDLYLAYPDAKAVSEYNYAIEQLIARGYTHYTSVETSLLDTPHPLQTIENA